jgi:SAM-dependent methyltransferase
VEIGRFLAASGAVYRRSADEAALVDEVASALERGRVVGWFQGRMEFGPRALGGRSILADARGPAMQATINQKVKFREGFRPFAPVVLEERAGEYFALEPARESPYMLLVAPVREERRPAPEGALRDERGLDRLRAVRSEVPAVTHVDGSARVQTVDAERHGALRRLLEAFDRRAGCPVLVNTSFNLGWEPIVRSPEDAFATFMSSGLDLLALGPYLVDKEEQPAVVRAAPGRSPEEAREEALRELLRSPCHGAPLAGRAPEASCSECGARFGATDGIPNLFWPHDRLDEPGDVTERVKAFYEEHPFPDYDEHESLRSLIDKARRGRYAHALDRSIPYNGTVLEVGCGTGQLSNFLGIACRRVVATDLCLNSLRLGEGFRRRHGLDRVWFAQMNLFRPCFAPESFDVVLCNGVLHHTADPFGGFRSLLPLVRPGGHLVIGLYNRYGRFMTDVRRGLFRLSGGRGRWLDPVLRRRGGDDAKSRAWYADQYRHPHESKHTYGEVLEWLDRTGVEPVRTVPGLAGEDGGGAADLFRPTPRSTRFERFLIQGREALRGSPEGGLFVVIGRKPAAGADARRGAASGPGSAERELAAAGAGG